MGYDYSAGQPIEYYKQQFTGNAQPFCLPFYRYAVQSPIPELWEINVFEKAVLGIRQVKKMPAFEIGQYLGLEKELIQLILNRLTIGQLLDEKGKLTPMGLAVLNKEDVYWDVQATDFSTGYVYQNLISGELFSRFNKKISLSKIRRKEGTNYPKVDVKHEGESKLELPVFCSINSTFELKPPSSEEVLAAVYKHNRVIAFSDETISKEKQLDLDKVALLDFRQLTWVLVAVFKDEESFAIADPFGLGKNAFLGEYLTALAEGNGYVQDQIIKLLNV